MLRGQTKISISRITEARLFNVRKQMIAASPEQYDEDTSINKIIVWLLDRNMHQTTSS